MQCGECVRHLHRRQEKHADKLYPAGREEG